MRTHLSLRKHRLSVFASVAVCALLFSAGVASRPASAAPTACTPMARPIVELINPATSAQLLTSFATEIASAPSAGFTHNVGSSYRASLVTATGLVPVYRLYKAATSDFMWAAAATDVNSALSQGYVKQRVEFYALPAANNGAGCATAVSRLVKGTKHRAAIASQVGPLTAAGWTNQGVIFQAVATAPITGVAVADPNPADTSFSFAVSPDTQEETYLSSNDRMSGRSRWLVANRAAYDLRYSLHVGDVTNWGWLEPSMFARAKAAFSILQDAGIPHQAAIGNHDTAAVDVGGSAYVSTHPTAPATAIAIRNTAAFNNALPVSSFNGVGGTFEAGKIDNSWSTFGAGGKKWLVLTLELFPRQSVITWAQGVVASHPEHLVIVVTHGYLEATGAISGSNGGYGATAPTALWTSLIKVYPNIRFVVSGHVGQAATRVDTGDKGNKIVSLLQTFHSTSNPVRIVTVDTASGTVQTKIVAPQEGAEWTQYAQSWTGIGF